jgi:hypothetical protein
MANLTESVTWAAGVYQIELTDPVIGGPGGISNLQAGALANRTAWLKAQVEALDLSLDGHLGVGGEAQHPLVTDSVAGFMSPAMLATLTSRAPLASPTFTGTPTVPTAAAGTNTTQAASTAFVQAHGAAALALANPLMDGTAAVGTATRLAREDHVHPTDSTRAPLASPALTGTPTAPTAATGTNTEQLATTAFVRAECSSSLGASGWQRLPGGLILQWVVVSPGSKANNTSISFNWPVTFPTACYSANLSDTVGTTDANGGASEGMGVSAITTTGGTLYSAWTGGWPASQGGPTTVTVWAIGS